jgi:Competence protein CoiA-like family
MAMIEIRPLYPRKWEPSEPLVAYNNADGRVVVAAEMRRGDGSYYDRYGYQGSKTIVCIDCKQGGKDIPVILVEAETKCIHFRHKAGEAPDGLRRHGETAEHLHGKQLVIDWAGDQRHILPWSVEEEFWVTGVRLRSDVKANLTSGRQLAFEVQRKPLDRKDWDRRHGGYQNAGFHDVWLWSPDVPDLVLDLPLTSIVLDMEHEELGVLVARYPNGYRHPTAERYILTPSHYASAPLSEWNISASGSLLPPPEMAEYIGDKPEAARRAQLKAHLEPAARPPQPGASSNHYGSGTSDGGEWSPSEREQQRINEALARIFSRK